MKKPHSEVLGRNLAAQPLGNASIEIIGVSTKSPNPADEITRLRAALGRIASHNGEPALDGAAHKIARATVKIARAALEASNG